MAEVYVMIMLSAYIADIFIRDLSCGENIILAMHICKIQKSQESPSEICKIIFHKSLVCDTLGR